MDAKRIAIDAGVQECWAAKDQISALAAYLDSLAAEEAWSATDLRHIRVAIAAILGIPRSLPSGPLTQSIN